MTHAPDDPYDPSNHTQRSGCGGPHDRDPISQIAAIFKNLERSTLYSAYKQTCRSNVRPEDWDQDSVLENEDIVMLSFRKPHGTKEHVSLVFAVGGDGGLRFRAVRVVKQPK